MINISELSLNFSGEPLFKDVNLKFTQGNCYGVIGANGAGKSTFLRILSGDLDPSTGTVSIAPKTRMSVLKQDHFAFNDETVLNTVLGGNERLLAVMREKDALYMKDPFTEEDGNKAAELEAEFAEMGGWEAESDVSCRRRSPSQPPVAIMPSAPALEQAAANSPVAMLAMPP